MTTTEDVNGWVFKSLRELATINYGKSPAAILSVDGLYPVVGTGGVERLGNDYLHEGDSIILGRKGSIDRVHFTTGRFWTIDTAYYLSDFSEAVPMWLFYFLQMIDLRQMSEATGVSSLSRDLLYNIKIAKPPKPEQSKIAEILSIVDRAIEETEALIAKQQRIKTGLMQDLLTRGIDEEGNLRSEKTHEFKDSPLGRIPVEWETRRLYEFTEVKGGKRLPAGHHYTEMDRGFRYLRVLDFYEREIDFASLVSLKEGTFKTLSRYEIKEGQLCVSIAGSLGFFSVFRPPSGMRTILTENAARIVPSGCVIPEYLSAFLNSHIVQTQIEAAKGTGGGVPKLALFRIQSLLVAMPIKKNEQEKILERLRPLRLSTQKNISVLHKLRSLKTGLMQDLLTGRVRVTALLDKAEEVSI